MDNTRVITSSGTVCGGNEKMIVASKKNCNSRFNHHQTVLPQNTGSMFSLASGNGAQILLNARSIDSATNMQFLVPNRSKSMSYNGLPTVSSIKFMQLTSLTTQPNPTPLLSTGMKQFNYINVSNAVTSRSTPEITFEDKSIVNNSNTLSMHETNADFLNEKPQVSHQDGEGNSTIVTTIKNFFSSLIRPLLEGKTMSVGSNNAKMWSWSTSIPPKRRSIYDWTETNGVIDDDDISPIPDHHKSLPVYYDNHSNDRFCFNSESSSYYMNYMPETFFDCDDYLEGGEDTIDFVASSTKLPITTAYATDLTTESLLHQSPTDNNMFYDCINKFSCINDTVAPVITDELKCLHEQQKIITEPAIVNLDLVSKCSIFDIGNNTESVQCNDDKLPMNCPKYEKPNRNMMQRKRKEKQKSKSAYRNRGNNSGLQKNRHEKIRHEVAMNIHDDCFTDDEEDADTDLEIIDVDDHRISDTTSLECTSTKSSQPEIPVPSPEVIPSGCMFTRFFRFDRLDFKPKSLPIRCMQLKQVPQLKPTRERQTMIACRRTSETESDDSFIVFEENSSPRPTIVTDDFMSKHTKLKDTYRRQRQISECSDDFIFFANDDNDYDCTHRYDTTDEDFTDSTDDSDNSEDGKHNFIKVSFLFSN